jgi:Rrf2 family protein
MPASHHGLDLLPLLDPPPFDPLDPAVRRQYPSTPVGIHLKISQRGLYALKALIHLAERWDGGPVSTHEIADREGIPEKFLEAILLTLKNARIVKSRRGREGGYELRRPPAEIVVGDVVRLLDGPLAPFGDAAELTRLIRTEPRHAGLFDLFLEVRNAAAVILDNTTLADLLERDRKILVARHEEADAAPEPK